ncbi:MAG: hypothetical protein IV100_27075 [Myxococcales bacterium]|nr:hypothetical protein [Myxococcales bacterium]
MVHLLLRLAFVVPTLLACSSASGGSSRADATTAVTAAAFGARCTSDSECESGLCLASDYAPFRFCSAACDLPDEACLDDDGAAAGFCVAFPAEFAASEKTICLPLCDALPACQSLATQWEKCEAPNYKGNLIGTSATGVKVCSAPSQNGKPIVDTATCAAWETGWETHATQISVCRAYCNYLSTCGVVPDGANLECCAYGCFREMVAADGEIDIPFEKDVKCFVTSYSSVQGTTKVCTEPPIACGQEPADPTRSADGSREAGGT